jgi:threonine/homoserine/homoserine lactone efflux protein
VGLPDLLKGFAIGLSIAAPVGPIGVLCLRRALSEGPRAGLATGLGAATADSLYGAVAAFGLTTISGFLTGAQSGLQLGGGGFLVYLGLRTWREPPAGRGEAGPRRGLLWCYASTLALTLANPATILSFVAVFAGFGFGRAPGLRPAAALVAGIFLGSAAWWLILSLGAGYFGARLRSHSLQWINRFSGAVLIGCGVFALVAACRR